MPSHGKAHPVQGLVPFAMVEIHLGVVSYRGEPSTLDKERIDIEKEGVLNLHKKIREVFIRLYSLLHDYK